MSYSKTVHEYLDGDLDPQQQETLFSQLAVNRDLRSEFNQQIKLHLIAQSDMGTISPPLESTNAIFSSLGFSIPSRAFVQQNGGNAGGYFGKFKTFWAGSGRILPYILTTLLTAGLTAVILYFLMNNMLSDKISYAISSLSNNRQQIPVVQSYEKTNTQPEKRSDNITLTKKELEKMFSDALNRALSNAFGNPAYPSGYETLANNEQANGIQPSYASGSPAENLNRDVSMSLINPAPKLFEAIQNRYMASVSMPEPYQPVMFMNPTSGNDQTRISLQLRNFQTNSNPDIKLQPKANTWFRNMAASLMYELDKNNSVGVEVGQETFGQEFNTTSGNITYTFKQNPLLFWAGVAYKHTAKNLPWVGKDVVYPYAQAMVGGSSVGFIGKGQLGLQFQPDKRVTFSVGWEGSILGYSVENNIYNTTKSGITYGIGIHY